MEIYYSRSFLHKIMLVILIKVLSKSLKESQLFKGTTFRRNVNINFPHQL